LPSATDDETQILSVPIRLRRCGREITTRIDADLDTHALYGAGERFLCRFGIIDRLPEPKSIMPPTTPT
jgi:hypothetical protein